MKHYNISIPNGYWARVSPHKDNFVFEPSYRIYESVSMDMPNQDFFGFQKGFCKIGIKPKSGASGTNLRVNGGIFSQGELIRIDFGNQATITTAIADSQGLFSTTFVAPAQMLGTKVITAFGLSSTLSTTAVFLLSEPIPKITLHKEAIYKQGSITYTIIYTNEGEGTATDVNIIEVLPEKCKVQSVKSKDEVSYWYEGKWQAVLSDKATKIKWVIPVIGPTEVGTVTFTVKVE